MVIYHANGHAQNNYYPGYVILNTNDTIYGTIQDRNISKGRLLKRIRFKPKKGKKKKFDASDLSGYSIQGTVFESKWYAEESSFLKFYYPNKYGVGQKTFLRVHVKGGVSCYTKEFIDGDNNLIDGFELFLKTGDDHYQRATQGIFGLKKKKLVSYFKDCPKLVNHLTENTFKSAQEVANYYNINCKFN